MHELSLAKSIFQRAVGYTPATARITGVTVRVGPLQSIDPVALRWAWHALVRRTAHAGATVTLEYVPWRLRCRTCGREFESARLTAVCQCGAESQEPIGGDELILESIDVRDVQDADHAGASTDESSHTASSESHHANLDH